MMKVSKKPLHVYEQSMLLVGLLFARKNIDDILSFLPNDQVERMTAAKSRFLQLEQSDLVAKVILELRRLLLFSQRKIDWIHKSWIDDALAQEPAYLKPLIEESLKSSGNQTKNISPLPPNVIFHSFLNQFTTTQKKVAIFDPILMRLQSMRDEDQEKTLLDVGALAFQFIAKRLHEKRLAKFIKIASPSEPPLKNNPFTDPTLKTIALRHIISLRHHPKLKPEVGLALFIIALHLSNHSHSWQATTALILKKPLGSRLLEIIQTIQPSMLTPVHRELIRELLMESIDEF